MSDHTTHEAFRNYLRDELLKHRPEIGPEGADELADATAAAVPDDPAMRRAFLGAYWDECLERESEIE